MYRNTKKTCSYISGYDSYKNKNKIPKMLSKNFNILVFTKTKWRQQRQTTVEKVRKKTTVIKITAFDTFFIDTNVICY